MANFYDNPLFLAGMGMLGGNTGPTSGAAFAGGMRGGLAGLQQGLLNRRRDKLVEVEQKDAERRNQEYQRMAQQRQAIQAHATKMLKDPKISPDQRAMYTMMAAGANPSAAGQFGTAYTQMERFNRGDATTRRGQDLRHKASMASAANSGKDKYPPAPTGWTKTDQKMVKDQISNMDFAGWDVMSRPDNIESDIMAAAENLMNQSRMMPGRPALGKNEAVQKAIEFYIRRNPDKMNK